MTYLEIQNILKKADLNSLPKLNISILRNIMLESMLPYIKFMAYEMGFEAKVQIGEYDNIIQESMGSNSSLLNKETNCVLVFLRLEGLSWKLARNFAALSKEEIQNEFLRIKELLPGIITGIRKQTDALVLWHGFELPLYPSFGISDSQNPNGQVGIIQQLNDFLRSTVAKFPNAYYVDLNLCIGRLGQKAFYDNRYWHIGRAPYSLSALQEITAEDFKFLRPLKGKNKKCLVLDCDNVLWGGIIGEDGLAGIKLGKTYPGSIYYEFQEEIVNLFHKGILIALCSKNNKEDVEEVFQKHPDMVLKEKHIVASEINWDDKVTNLKKIANTLNIGLDSLVFADDSEFEINLVRQALPEVTVIHLHKEKGVDYRDMLASCGLFDTLVISEEDRQRGAMYKAEEQRKQLQTNVPDLESYLKSLEMVIEIKSVDDFTIPRVSQLTQKTNQFNLTTKRYSEADIQNYANSSESDVLYLRVLDKFGDSGIVGVSIIKYTQNEALLDSFLLSCRVLGRGIEDVFMLHTLKIAQKKGYKQMRGKFIPTTKNAQAKDFLSKQGFNKENIFDLTKALKPQAAYFKEINSSEEKHVK